MAKVYVRIISHVGGNLTFQVKQKGAEIWTDKQLGMISIPSDNEEFIARVRADVASFTEQGDEVIWIP